MSTFVSPMFTTGLENNSANDKWQERDQNFERKSKFNEKNNYEGKVDL